MDVTKLVGINLDIPNVYHVPYPHPGIHAGEQGAADVALFMGTPFRVIPGLNRVAYVKRVNECLDYLREQCKGCRLRYLVHPAEIDEYRSLDLRDFEIIPRERIDDTYFERHRHEFRYVFAAHSIAAMFAYSLGLNAYLFLDCFRDIYPKALFEWYRQVCFTEMPASFFIGNLTQTLIENKKIPSDGHELFEGLKKIIPIKGTIWFTFQVAPMDVLLSTVGFVRQQYPGRRIGLLLYRHHRWDVMDLDVLRPYFDEVHVFSRVFYSLRPRRLMQMFQMTRAIKRFPVGSDDIVLGFVGYELLENCFISYHSKSLRISIWTNRSFLVHQNTASNSFFRTRSYSYTPASYIYNKVILPLLGLHRVLFLKPRGADRELYAIHRYERPMNELYDHVFYLHA